MIHKAKDSVTTIGTDIANNSFHLTGLDERVGSKNP